MTSRLALLAVALGLLSGCSFVKVKPDKLVGDNLVRMEALPPGTVKAGDDVWMIPLSEPDPDGCLAYRMYSPNRESSQAMFYQRWDESFTAVKSEAACYGARK